MIVRETVEKSQKLMTGNSLPKFNILLGCGFKYLLILNPTWGSDPNFVIFFRWVETTSRSFFHNQLSRQSRKVHWRGLCNSKSQFLTLHLIHQYIRCRQTRQTPPAMVGSFKMFVRIHLYPPFPSAANQLLEGFIAINFVHLHLFLLGDILYGFCNGKSSPSTHQMSAIFFVGHWLSKH